MKFRAFLSALLTVGLLAVGAADAATNRASWARAFGGNVVTDTLTWSQQGSFSKIDTIVGNTNDTTTTLLSIAGTEAFSAVVTGTAITGTADAVITPQVSNDGVNWVSLRGTYTFTGNTSIMFPLKAGGALTDTLVAGTVDLPRPSGGDMLRAASARYIRFIADNTADSLSLVITTSRVYPND